MPTLYVYSRYKLPFPLQLIKTGIEAGRGEREWRGRKEGGRRGGGAGQRKRKKKVKGRNKNG